MSDPRFARLKSDPRFRRPKKHQNKVVIDERFKGVFDSKKAKGQGGRVDKYGRAVAKNAERDNLRRFYRLEDEEDDGADEQGAPTRPDYARGEGLLESSDEDADESEDDDGVVTVGRDRAHPIRVAEPEEVELDEREFAALDAQAAAAQASDAARPDVPPSRRIAAVNLDWDHVRAAHLFKIFASVVAGSAREGVTSATTGHVARVRVYASEFGKARLAREEAEGPPAEVFRRGRELDADEVNAETVYELGEEGEVDEDALRKYQLERMRYYYAIAEFDSEGTAQRVYEELDGTELERSANVFDLSYVPDDMTFDDEPRDEASTDSATYRGLDFVTDALRHSKVKLHWDEDDPERDRVTRRALTKKQVEEEDFGALIASSGSESESEGAVDKRERMRALLLSGDGGDALPEGWGADRAAKGTGDMQITFTPGLSGNAGADAEDENTLEKYQRKMREQRKKRKEEHTERKDKGKAANTSGPDEFFGSASEDEASKQGKGRKEKKAKAKAKEAPPPARAVATADELALIAAPTDAEPRHFDMKSIVKAEKKVRRKKGKKGAAVGEPEELQEDFAIDVRDDRFVALHEDHAFAIDPSNPHFKKTKSMSALLDERAKRRKRDDRAPAAVVRAPADSAPDSVQNLERLVESVKRKGLANAEGAAAGKRRRT